MSIYTVVLTYCYNFIILNAFLLPLFSWLLVAFLTGDEIECCYSLGYSRTRYSCTCILLSVTQ